MQGSDTIAALSSPPGRGAVAVVRISGPQAHAMLQALAHPAPAPRRASLRWLSVEGRRIDQAVVLWFPSPRSFTGEDSAEFQVHGSRAVVDDLLQALTGLGCRLAEPGEFTRRALMNGRMSLLEVEALADLLAAETAQQQQQALFGMSGGSGEKLDQLRQTLVGLLAVVDASIEFPDEGDVPQDVMAGLAAKIDACLATIARWLEDWDRVRVVQQGLVVALVGAPNAGKSSLLNALARSDIAIVSDQPGTTRDVIRVDLDLSGAKVTLVDTAGLRDTEDRIEAEGVRRARLEAQRAELVLYLQAPGSDARDGDRFMSELNPAATCWVIDTKADLSGAEIGESCISIQTRNGIDPLMARLSRWVQSTTAREPGVVATERQRALLVTVRSALETAAFEAIQAGQVDVIAENVRQALHALGRMVGRIGQEEVLDDLFGRFCIGK